MNKSLSNCCHAPLKINSGNEGTSFYYCSKCEKACDPAIDKELVMNKNNNTAAIERFRETFYTDSNGGIRSANTSDDGETDYDLIISFISEELEQARREEKNRIWETIQKAGNYLPGAPGHVEPPSLMQIQIAIYAKDK